MVESRKQYGLSWHFLCDGNDLSTLLEEVAASVITVSGVCDNEENKYQNKGCL